MSPSAAVRRWGWTLLALGAAPLAAASGGDEKVTVTVVAVLASDQSDKIDPKLDLLAKEVQKVEPKLTGFRLAKSTCKPLAVGQSDDFALVADQTASVKVERGADPDDRVQLKVTPPQMGEITYETACGKFFPVITPYRTPAGEVLIIAVRVQPCRGK
jgi:hypothetical protein